MISNLIFLWIQVIDAMKFILWIRMKTIGSDFPPWLNILQSFHRIEKKLFTREMLVPYLVNVYLPSQQDFADGRNVSQAKKASYISREVRW